MKGVNASRIAALAAGAVLLSSSVIAASVLYEDVELVNLNGQPTAKIVVGSDAQISDGVAAANIASVLANYAYKSSTVTAEPSVDGEVCGGAGSASGAGTCEVTGEKVTIEITLPGVIANAHGFSTLISDFIDKTPANRMYNLSEDYYNGKSDASTRSDASETLTPLRSSDIAIQELYMIGSGQFSGFAPVSVVDNQASDATYTAEQAFWVGGRVSGYSRESTSVYYDSNSAYRSIVARPRVVAYSLTFKGNDYGIPLCTSNLATSGEWGSCNSTSYQSDQHRIKIPFLGEEWIISGMTRPVASGTTNSISNSQGVVSGGEIKLAKEAKYDIVNVGGVVDGGDFKVRLADISVATGSNNAHPAILDVMDANDAVVGQIQVNPGDTYEFVQSSTGKSIKVHVYRTAPGFTLSAKWAEMAIYTDEIILEDGKRYNRASSDDVNYKYLKASLYWKNRDSGSTATLNQTDSLREIVLWDQESFDNSKMVAGDQVNFPKKNTAYRLTYNGLDLTDSDYETLSISNNGNTELSICGNLSTTTWDCSTKNGSAQGYFLKISTGYSGGFGGDSAGILDTDRTDVVYLDPIGVYYVNSSTINGTVGAVRCGSSETRVQFGSTFLADTNHDRNDSLYPTVFYKTSSDDYYRFKMVTPVTTLANPAATVGASDIYFDVLGADSGSKGVLHLKFRNSTGGLGRIVDTNSSVLNYSGFYDANPASGASLMGEVVIQEDAGKANSTSHSRVWTRVPIMNLTSNEWRFKATDSATAYSYYGGISLVDSSVNTPLVSSAFEPTLYTERGSKVTSVGTTSFDFMAAKKVGAPSFTFSYADEELASSGELWEATEGEEKSLSNGIKLKVKDISQTVGTCKATTSEGATASCEVNMDALSARIMPNNVASVEVIEPYDIRSASDMVMMDSEAGTAGGVVISVGGPVVNSVTADVLADAAVDFDTTSVYVKAHGSKIIVAGKTSADTMQAAEEFIGALQKN